MAFDLEVRHSVCLIAITQGLRTLPPRHSTHPNHTCAGLLEGLEVYEALPTCGDGHRLLASIHEAGTSTPDRDPPPEYTTKYAGDVEGQ